MIVVVDELRKLVASTEKIYGKSLFFFHGHLKDISANFSLMGSTNEWSKQKYPCVVLLQDFAVERPQRSRELYEAKARLQLLILAQSNPGYIPEQRLSQVFKPVLYPIYEAFATALSHSRVLVGDTSHTQVDRLRMHRALSEAALAQGDKALFNDHLDGIEVRNLELKFRKNCM